MDQLNVVIHYWSATGNTAMAADLAAGGLRSGGAHVLVHDMRQGNGDGVAGADLWVVATPVFDFRPALPVQDFVRSLGRQEGLKVAALVTYGGFPDRAVSRLGGWLRRIGGVPWDYQGLRCEDSWPVLRRFAPRFCSIGEPEAQAREAFRAWWEAVPQRLAQGDDGRSWWACPTPLTLLAPFYSRALVGKWFRITVDLGACTRCGRCVDQCPTGRMRVDAFPKPPGDCIGCYGCVNVCPERAVHTYLTRGAPRYAGPGGSCCGEDEKRT